MSSRSQLRERIAFDNRFRLVVSWSSFVIASLLASFNSLQSFWPVALVIVFYNAPFLTVWFFLEELRWLRPTALALSIVDFAAITAAVRLTGQLSSPFFYLYPVPFLVHAFHFDLGLILCDSGVVVACFVGLLFLSGRHGLNHLALGAFAGQVTFLVVVIAAAIAASVRLRKKEQLAERNFDVMRTTVQFLERLNSLPPTLSAEHLQQELLRELVSLLKPLGIHSRLWIANSAWKTLKGLGEHPALRPGSPQHLPTVACPAFALRRAFRYHQATSDPCASEQFNYAKHLCIPVLNDMECLGVVFLGSYAADPWSAEEIHLFEMLAHSIALILHRKRIFESLQDKVSELNFSFEVGATGLATFVGSTQSIDETTVNILDGVLSILRADRSSLMLWDRQSQRLQTQWVRGGDFKVQSPMRLAMGEGMAGWALQTGEPYWAEYAMGDPHYVASGQPIQSLIAVPVYAMDRQPLGVINAVTVREARTFSQREINFLKWFGRQAALAIENAQLHHRSRNNIDQLNELSQMKSQFFSLVSHDLRGPLTGVRGLCEVLKMRTQDALSAQQLEILAQLERQVDLQERMVDDLLDFARMEKGQLSVVPVTTDIVTLLRDEVEKSQPEARERNVELQLSMRNPGEIPAIHADGGRIRQVIWNLIHNALKFTSEGGRIIVRLRKETGRLQFEVEDTGVGLPPETQDKIFDKFFQITPGGSRGAQGLGLGLAICKEIILAHHGQIQARSPGLGRGTTISFSLPLPQTQPAASIPLAA